MHDRIRSGGLLLAAHLARPTTAEGAPFPAVVLCHGYPSGTGEAGFVAATFPELADRMAHEMDWVALAVALRGCGDSEGSFSLEGWLEDLRATVDHLANDPDVSDVWLAGFGTGGALAVCAGANDPRVRGVAALAAPADFDDWANHPRRLLEHAREVGLIGEPGFPASIDTWARAFRQTRAVTCVQAFAPRPLLLVHGSDDDVVPPIDARVLADAHGHAELRILEGAGHRLRHDPRAVAVLLGWLDRQRHALRSA